MVDWANFTNILTQSMELVKVIHVLDGFFVWQYFRTLSFEINYYRGRRQLTPSFALYVFCRVLTFTSVFLQLLGFNLISEFDCRAWYRSVIFFSYAAVASGLAIFITLLFKLWGHKLVVIILPIVLWLSLIALMLRDVARADSTWIGLIRQCSPGDTAGSRNTAIIWLIVTIVMAGSVMLGLYAKKNSLGTSQRHAYEKAILWVSIPVLMQGVAVIFLCLNLNAPMNLMFQTPSLIACVTCATQMYRDVISVTYPNIRKHRTDIGVSYFSSRHSMNTTTVGGSEDIALDNIQRAGKGNERITTSL